MFRSKWVAVAALALAPIGCVEGQSPVPDGHGGGEKAPAPRPVTAENPSAVAVPAEQLAVTNRLLRELVQQQKENRAELEALKANVAGLETDVAVLKTKDRAPQPAPETISVPNNDAPRGPRSPEPQAAPTPPVPVQIVVVYEIPAHTPLASAYYHAEPRPRLFRFRR